MNWMINSAIKWLKSNPIIAIGIIIILAIFIWWFQAKLWNGIGNTILAAKMSWQGRSVQKDLESAAVQQKEIDQTLLELAKSKEALAAAAKERELAEKIFNDSEKTAKEKVAAYEALRNRTPVITDPTGADLNSLCAKARALGASQATIDGLCAK